MKKIIIGTLVVGAALALGVTTAFGISRMMNYGSPTIFSMMGGLFGRAGIPGIYGSQPGPGMMGSFAGQPGPGMVGGNGMMGGYGRNGQNPPGNRLSMEQAIRRVQDYVASAGANFTAAEIMEFNNNFYAAILEKDTGKGAFEVLVDPYTGNIFPEYGPNMMWNLKYGHMGNGSSQENTIYFDQAQANAQRFLDAQISGAQVEPDGFTFYGYYTFDYKVNDQIAGMLSVNGWDGQVWLHSWHGQFIAEKEMTQ